MGVKQTNNLGVTVQKDRLDQSMKFYKNNSNTKKSF